MSQLETIKTGDLIVKDTDRYNPQNEYLFKFTSKNFEINMIKRKKIHEIW